MMLQKLLTSFFRCNHRKNIKIQFFKDESLMKSWYVEIIELVIVLKSKELTKKKLFLSLKFFSLNFHKTVNRMFNLTRQLGT